jgi:hypothetical protein
VASTTRPSEVKAGTKLLLILPSSKDHKVVREAGLSMAGGCAGLGRDVLLQATQTSNKDNNPALAHMVLKDEYDIIFPE